MRNSSLKPLLVDSISQVLESMCFTMIDGETEDRPAFSVPRVEVSLTFRGWQYGQFWLVFPADVARESACAFSGNPELDESQTAEVIGEIANMICGATLSRYAGDSLFDLSSPSAVWIADELTPAPTQNSLDRIDLVIGPSVISAGIELEQAS